MWAGYRGRGVRRLLLAWTLDSPAELDELRTAVPEAQVTVCRLRASPATVVDRVGSREGPFLRERLQALALAYADRMERDRVEDLVVETEGRTIPQVASEMLARSGWLAAAAADRETPLSGGRLTAGVVRVGRTVRRPLGEHSAFVHELLCHLEAAGFDGAPRFLGVDDRDREILSFVEGWSPPDLDTWADEQVGAAARLLRRYHDATAGSALAGAREVVCHNDPSPCNFVFASGLPHALIDFDHAAPGERLRDVAYGCWLWALTSDDDGPPLADQARQLSVFVDAYGDDYRPVIVDAVLRRQTENLADALARIRAADPKMAAHGRASAAWHRREIAWLIGHREELHRALGGRRARDG